MCFQTLDQSAALEVPEDYVSLSVSGADELAIRREADLTSVAGDVVSGEPLLSILLQVWRREEQDLIVERLHTEPLLVRMHCDCWQAVHIRLGYVLDDNRDVEVPGSDGLVIRRSDEAAVLVYEIDCTV